jgi:hypothetical protein
MNWQVVTLNPPHDGQDVAEVIMRSVRDPLTRARMGSQGMVLRHREIGIDQFFFSPEVVPTFRALIHAYAGSDCEMPSVDPLLLEVLVVGRRPRWISLAGAIHAAEQPHSGLAR